MTEVLKIKDWIESNNKQFVIIRDIIKLNRKRAKRLKDDVEFDSKELILMVPNKDKELLGDITEFSEDNIHVNIHVTHMATWRETEWTMRDCDYHMTIDIDSIKKI